MIRSLLTRIKTGTTRAAVLIRSRARRAAATGASGGGGGERSGKNLRGTAGMDAEEAEETITRARSCVTFTRWLVRTLLVGSILVAP
jgi:hypothetical protein